MKTIKLCHLVFVLRLMLISAVLAILLWTAPETAEGALPEHISWKVAETGSFYPGSGDVYESLGPPVASGFGTLFRAQGTYSDGIMDTRDAFFWPSALVINTCTAPGGECFESFGLRLMAVDDVTGDLAFGGVVSGKEGIFMAQRGVFIQFAVANQGDGVPGSMATIESFTELGFANERITIGATLSPVEAGDPTQGLYLVSRADVLAETPTLETIFDTNTDVPDGMGDKFSGLIALTGSGTHAVSIWGTDGGRQVIVATDTGSGSSEVLVETGDAVPGGTGAFTEFSAVFIADGKLAFAGVDEAGIAGVYVVDLNGGGGPSPVGGNVARLRSSTTDGESLASIRRIAYSGQWAAVKGTNLTGLKGLYGVPEANGGWDPIVTEGDTFDGKTVTRVSITGNAMFAGRLSFRTKYNDGSQDIWTWRLKDAVETDTKEVEAFDGWQWNYTHNGTTSPGGIWWQFGDVKTTFQMRVDQLVADPEEPSDWDGVGPPDAARFLPWTYLWKFFYSPAKPSLDVGKLWATIAYHIDALPEGYDLHAFGRNQGDSEWSKIATDWRDETGTRVTIQARTFDWYTLGVTPRVTITDLESDQVNFSWQGRANESWEVQYKSAMNHGTAWMDASGLPGYTPPAHSDGTWTWHDESAGESVRERYFRVKMVY